ncbi:ATP synthase F1 subunit gamma [bacterium]|nr:ATP synthase F1 subunit gamma [bacterium]
MASLKEVRTRIASVKSTQQITKAMKMVSAAKLRRAQTKIQQMRPYAEKMNEMLGNVAGNLEGSNSKQYYEKAQDGKILFILVTSDRGLCGSFNSSLFKELKYRFEHELKDEYNAGKIELYCIGKKGRELFARYGAKIVAKNDGFFNKFDFEDAERIADELMGKFTSGEYKEIHVVYNQFKNAATYFGLVEQWLPISAAVEEQDQSNMANYIFEPGKTEILDELVPRSLKISLFKAMLDSNASEHGSRMTAMDSATENAQEMLRNLSIEYNKARQAAITTEILEIVGGAEALANG